MSGSPPPNIEATRELLSYRDLLMYLVVQLYGRQISKGAVVVLNLITF